MVRLNGGQRILLQAVRDLPKDSITGFVVDTQLAENTRIAQSQVKDLLRTLEETGLVDVARTEEGLKAAITASGRIHLQDCIDHSTEPFLLPPCDLSGGFRPMTQIESTSSTARPTTTSAVFDRIKLEPRLSPEPGANIKLKLYIEISNSTPFDLVISSASFTTSNAEALRFDPLMSRNVDGATYFCEFLNDRKDAHTEFRSFLRPKQSITTFVGLDPILRNDDVLGLLKSQSLGNLEFNITCWDCSDHPSTYPFRRSI